ncbi:LOW QUALITY PROTEIN: hydrocephalus-inducing protein homolog [Pogoniulus pusillus]|uniref:LOW QUALITY PROTEIN: hydrocephalus-inducing protein homolog n=1 Tax=Pogoniulus pusillus TaxID=488313 RepID=UPI0030B940C2
MATGKHHHSLGASKASDGIQRAVAAPGQLKLAREAKEPVTLTASTSSSSFSSSLSVPMDQSLPGTQEVKLPRIIQKPNKPEERRLPLVPQLPGISAASHPKLPSAGLGRSCFEPVPPEVLFQGCVPHRLHRAPLLLRNRDKVPRQVKVTLESSPYFRVLSPKDVCQKVAPGMFSTFHVLFTPEENKDYCHQLLCVTEGDRFTVPIRAVGAKAALDLPQQLNFSLCPVKHSTQRTLLLRNVGEQQAQYSISTQSPFSAAPSLGALGAGEAVQVTVEFLPLQTGEHRGALTLHSDTGWQREGSCLLCPGGIFQPARGCATGPTLHFDVPSLDFGDVSFGFPHSLSCCLSNTSLVPLPFTLRVPGDGTAEPSVPSAVLASDPTHPAWRQSAKGHLKPCEFSISPGRGTIRALSCMDVQVTLCSNTVGTYKLALVVDVDGVGQELLSLPLTARCVVPALRVPSPVVPFGRCYLKLPAQQLLPLVNDSDLPGCYLLLPQEHQEDAAVLYSSPVPCGIIQAHSCVEVPVRLAAQVAGEQHTAAHVVLFGRAEAPLEIHLVSLGAGPVVSVHPSSIDLGSVQVLQDSSRSLQLCNQSPIPASFRARLPAGGSCWRVEPSQGEVPAGGEVSLRVTANLRDTERCQAELQLLLEHSPARAIPLRARGVGTTILTDRPLAPHLSLGTRFSLVPCSYSFRVSNRGRRRQQLRWSTAAARGAAQRRQLPARGTAPCPSPAAPCPVFHLRPARMELAPGQTMEVVLEGFSSTPQVVREQLLCQAVVGREARKTQVMQVDISCQFIDPALQVSPTAVTFQVEKQPGHGLSPQYQPLALKNSSSLPLSIILALEQPFSVCDVDLQPFPLQPTKLEAGQELQLRIGFDPAHGGALRSWRAEQELRIGCLEHPRQQRVALRAEVSLPSLRLLPAALHFGCVLNGTEAVRSLRMANCSPRPLRYCWQLLPAAARCSSPAHRACGQAQAVREEGACPECSASAGSCSAAGGVEEPAQALAAAGHPAQEPAGAEDSLEAKLFAVLPLQGVLQPGQSQQVTFSFFGQPNVVACATALCRVQGGPTYEVQLSGEASCINYLLDSTELDLQLQQCDVVTEAEVTLQNRGKLPFTFQVLSPSSAAAHSLLPGVPLVLPSSGSVGAGQQQVLKVSYLPGVPGVFCKTFQLQVAHLEPAEICLKGEGSFPRIHLDLPRNIQGNEKYEKVLKEVMEKLAQDSERHGAVGLEGAAATEPPPGHWHSMLDAGLQMQLEDLLIKEHILEQLEALSTPREAASEQPARQRLLKAELPEHLLDFGCVAAGSIHSHVVRVTNTGQLPVSFHIKGQLLRGTGFSVDLERVKQLHYCQTRTFQVCFQPPRGSLAELDVLLPIEVAAGPTFGVRLRARVAVPSLCLSRDRLEFSPVQCGQCQEETIRLYNQLPVPCQWFLSRAEPAQKVQRRLAASRRSKLPPELQSQACVFEVLPSAGVLPPGQWCNLRVRFAPVAEKPYRSKLRISLCQSSQHLQLLVSGRGLEPRLDFQPEVLELGPVLPCSRGAEGRVVVRNPCQFPIEFYSLEFDQQYLAEEEELLRALGGCDRRRTWLLPARAPGHQLPTQLLQRLQEEQAEPQREQPTAQDEAGQQPSSTTRGALDASPAHRSLACHLGATLCPAGAAPPQHRGMVIIVHGAPLAGKTSVAAALARRYGAACLSLEAAVRQALAASSSLPGQRARELCASAASGQSQRQPQHGRPRAAASLRHSAKASPSSPLSCSSCGDRGRQQPPSSRGQPRATAGRDKAPAGRQLLVESSGSQHCLSCSGSTAAAELGPGSCLLPDELLVAILRERLQLSDCCQGVVVDGLQSSFAGSTASALLCLLRAVGDRPHIYLVNLHQDYASWQARQRAAEEQAGREQEEAARKEAAELWELGEEEYEALPEQQRAQLDGRIRQLQRDRRQRLQEQLARELEGKQLKEEEELRKRKQGKSERGKGKGQQSQSLAGAMQGTAISDTNNCPEVTEGAEPMEAVKEHPGDKEDEEEQRKVPLADTCLGKAPLADTCSEVVVQPSDPQQEEAKDKAQGSEKDLDLRGSEKDLALSFKAYESSRKDVAAILSCWDRAQGVLLSPSAQQEEKQQAAAEQRRHLASRRSRKGREKEQQERLQQERLQQEKLQKVKAAEDSKLPQLEGEGAAGAGRSRGVGVPCLDIEVLSSADVVRTVLESDQLPRAEQVLAELGLGPLGPPIPPPALYSVVRCPERQELPAAEGLQHFTLLLPEPATVQEEKKDTQSVPTVKSSEEQGSPGRGRWRKEKATSSQEAARKKQSSGHGRRDLQRPATEPAGHQSQQDTLAPPGRPGRSSYRWVVPAQGQVELQLHFSSEVPGQFEQRLHFELLGTRRRYQLHCRGSCLHPSICQEPGVVFPRCRRSKADADIIFKEYVLSTGVFHFGPLLCGKSRAWYKALQPPSHCEKISILNATPLEAEVSFSFQRDTKADTFLLEPPSMKLKPQEKQELSLWAYPTAAGLLEDKLICCIKDNPEPVLFQLCCQGVQLQLGVSPKQLHFGRVLLHREQSRTLLLRNSCPLPVAWHLSGLQNLGEGFSVSQQQGTVEPRSELSLRLRFKATKALSLKKMIRLEVSDADNVQGIVQVENIQVQAEAYDVALHISTAKGADGCVDFGVLKVLDGAKQVLTLKNQGKYEIAYRFRLDTRELSTPDLGSQLTVQPQQGLLPASERPVPIQLLFHPRQEISIEDKPILLCQVIEPSLCAGGETIAAIPVRLSARAVFSRYSLSPAALLSFGAMLSGTRRSCSLLLHNRGLLPFDFLICRAQQAAPGLPRESAHQRRSSQCQARESFSTASAKPSKLHREAHLTLGIFTVSPAFGCIPAGGQQLVTVECSAGLPGVCQEHLGIDISNRDPKDNPLGIPYKLLAESCLPGLVVDDLECIFEEHRVWSSSLSSLSRVLQAVQPEGVFLAEQKRFLFPHVLLGQQATARFKLRNAGRVPCALLLCLQPSSSRGSSRAGEAFRVEPARMCVPSCSHAFATVTFTPHSIQSYHCTFEASLDVQASPAAVPGQSLSFAISGAGKLPEVRVLRPALRDAAGTPLLLFGRLLLGSCRSLPLVLHNSGAVPAQVLLDLLDAEGVFFLKAKATTKCLYQAVGTQEGSAAGERQPHTACLLLQPGQAAEFQVLCRASLAQRLRGQLHLSVLDNPYEESSVRLLGEGYEDDFSLDSTQGRVAESQEQLEEEGREGDHLQLGHCPVGTPCTATFTLTNRSEGQVLRFHWQPEGPFHFSPRVGHLHPGCAKDITVTLKSDTEVTFRRHPVKCQLSRISFQLPAEQVPDWDDRLGASQWVGSTQGTAPRGPLKKQLLEPRPEPAHSVLEGSSREVQLLLSALVAYAEVKLGTERVEFQGTLMCHTSTSSFPLCNTGNVALEYTWMEAVQEQRAGSCSEELLLPTLDGDLHSSTPVTPQSSPCLSHASEQVSSTLSSCLEPTSASSVFSIQPCSGTIPAGQEQQFQLKFSPLEVGDFQSRMLCRIPNLRPGQKGPEVAVRGRSLACSYCIELEDSDCNSGTGLNPELQGAEGPRPELCTRLLHFAAVGVSCRRSRTFRVLNPTSSAFSFRWSCQDPEAPPEVAFSCLLERGQIQPGQKAEMKFEFTPWHLAPRSPFWVFAIPEQKVSVPFLLVGTATDPLVTLDRCHLNLQQLLIGQEVQQTITMINSEEEAFSFAFRGNSLFSEDCSTSLRVEPLRGSIAPLARLPIRVSLTPAVEGEVVFNLRCDVQGKPQPLRFNLKATGCSLAVAVQAEGSDGRVRELSARRLNRIDLQEVQLNDTIRHIFRLCNRGKLSFSFCWELRGPAACRQALSITPASGSVWAGGSTEAQLVFHPQRMCPLKDVELVLQISKGPSFTCLLLATVVVPRVHFSTTSLNFGACFLSQPGLPPARRSLLITNKADKALSLTCLFTSTAHLEVDFPGCILQAGGTVEVPITFCPREAASYRELVPFEVNGLCRQAVEVRGRGVEVKVDVLEPPGQVVMLGALSIGQVVKKEVTIANNSAAPLTFKLSLMTTTPELQEAGVLSLSPSHELSLKGRGGSCKVEVTFSPKRRIRPFTEEVLLEGRGLLCPLFVLQGSCQGIQVSLDQEQLSFGAVVQRSCRSQRLAMRNTGDLAASFQWDTKSCQPEFSISPSQGYIQPGMEVPLVVTFRPSKLSPPEQCQELQCLIPGTEPLRLVLAGCCLPCPVAREVLSFSCPVREEQTQSILVSNPTDQACTLQPLIEGEHWRGPQCLQLEAKQQQKPYPVTYCPLTMSAGRQHQGSVFLPLPGGAGLCCLLQGAAEPPRCSGSILRRVRCGTPHTELLPVSNWLRSPQRFQVLLRVLKPESLESSSLLQGAGHIEVPGSATKDYSLTFLSYREGVFSTMVTFLNEVTQEYLFHRVTFQATPAGPIRTLELSAAVGHRVAATLQVPNPLPAPVTFAIRCKVPGLRVPPRFTVPALAEADLVVEYQPLTVGEGSGHLLLQSSELGTLCYSLLLRASTGSPEQPLCFCTTLGSRQSLTTTIRTCAQQRTEYLLQTNSAAFQTEKSITVTPASPGGTELSLEVTYEPCQLGETHAILQLSSALGTEHSIPLRGIALPPEPQGPFSIRAGSSLPIPFQNVFLQPMAFQCQVEHPAFSARAPQSLRAKATTLIHVSFQGDLPVSSKMVVTCPGGPSVSWVYYLQGLPSNK